MRAVDVELRSPRIRFSWLIVLAMFLLLPAFLGTNAHFASNALNFQTSQKAEPNFPACPAEFQSVLQAGDGKHDETSTGILRKLSVPQSRTYQLSLTSPSELTVIGWSKEGHPEDPQCSDFGGLTEPEQCNQHQQFESYQVFLDDNEFGRYRDENYGPAENAWFSAGPWSTSVSAGTHELKFAHLMEGPPNAEQSVNYKVNVCIRTEPTPCPDLSDFEITGPVESVGKIGGDTEIWKATERVVEDIEWAWEEAATATSYRVRLASNRNGVLVMKDFSAASVCRDGECTARFSSTEIVPSRYPLYEAGKLDEGRPYQLKVTALSQCNPANTKTARQRFQFGPMPNSAVTVRPSLSSGFIDQTPVFKWGHDFWVEVYRLRVFENGKLLFSSRVDARNSDLCKYPANNPSAAFCELNLGVDCSYNIAGTNRPIVLGAGHLYEWTIAGCFKKGKRCTGVNKLPIPSHKQFNTNPNPPNFLAQSIPPRGKNSKCKL